MRGEQPHLPFIDGLRAIAVAAVVLFHAAPSALSGGYVGVDIFFVISGYVITRMIKRDIADHRFSITDFWARRIRRLLPALLATVIITLICAGLWMPPEELRATASQAIAAILSVSNLYFWSAAGYFAPTADTNPLLHTWSLGVEEQFYIVWPLLLFGLMRLPTTLRLTLIAVAAGTSLVVGEYMLSIDDGAAFYLTPLRLYEFAIGALLTWARPPAQGYRAELFLIGGLSLILYSATTFHSMTPFPGLSALVPCLGAALVIYAGEARHLGRLLANPTAVWLGRISYSLYLTHWPVYVFYRAHSHQELTVVDSLLVIAISLVAAVLLHVLVEQRFRYRRPSCTPHRFATALCLTVVATAGVALTARDGWAWRLPPELREKIDLETDRGFIWTSMKARHVGFDQALPGDDRSGPKVLVIGDSMAADFVNILEAAGIARASRTRSLRIFSRCHPIIAMDDSKLRREIKRMDRRRCRAMRARVFASPLIAQADYIFLAGNWAAWTPAHVAETAHIVGRNGAVPVAVVSLKTMQHTPEKMLFRLSERPLNAPSPLAEATNAEIRRALSEGTRFIDLMGHVCDEGGCRVLTESGRPIYLDQLHLSPSGARHFAEALQQRHTLPNLMALSAHAIPVGDSTTGTLTRAPAPYPIGAR